MRSTEERIKMMHKRAAEMQKKREKMLLAGMGIVSAFLGIILIAFTGYSIGAPGAVTDAAMAGASMLAENAGGYVLVAVAAFFAAVMITVVCLKYRKNRNILNVIGPDGEKND